MRGKRHALCAVVAGALATLIVATVAAAAPSPTPAPTPAPQPPSSGGGSSSPPRPTGPTAVADGASGAELAEAVGEQTKAPTPPPVTTAPETTTSGAGAVPPPTESSGTPTPEPTVTDEVPAPAPARAPAAAVLPRDGLIVLFGVLAAGLAVAVRAIRSRERRIGWALLGFCLVYLLVLAGLVTGVAGAAIPPPSSLTATPGDGAILLTFDAPATGTSVWMARRSDGPPSDCQDPTPGVRYWIGVTAAEILDDGLSNGSPTYYALCTQSGSTFSSSVQITATAASARDLTPPGLVTRARAAASDRSVVVSWRNPTDADLSSVIVVRKIGAAPVGPGDGERLFEGAGTTVVDHPFSTRPVHYGIFTVDGDANVSAPVDVSVPKWDPPLRSPIDGAVLAGSVSFSWLPVRKADYYVLRVTRGRTTVVNRRVSSTSTMARLRPAMYRWTVLAHVGKSLRKLGSLSFRVR